MKEEEAKKILSSVKFEDDGYFSKHKPFDDVDGELDRYPLITTKHMDLEFKGFKYKMSKNGILTFKACSLTHNRIVSRCGSDTWVFPELSFNTKHLNPEKAYNIYAICSKETNSGTWYLEEDYLKDFSETDYNFKIGVLYHEQDGLRYVEFATNIFPFTSIGFEDGKIIMTTGSLVYEEEDDNPVVDWEKEDKERKKEDPEKSEYIFTDWKKKGLDKIQEGEVQIHLTEVDMCERDIDPIIRRFGGDKLEIHSAVCKGYRYMFWSKKSSRWFFQDSAFKEKRPVHVFIVLDWIEEEILSKGESGSVFQKNDPSLSSVHTTKHPIEASITGWDGYTNLSFPVRAFSKKGEQRDPGTPPRHPHYNNEHGSLYKIASDLGLNAYEFDILKRIARCRKKGQFEQDLQKIKDTVDLYLKEHTG